MNIPGFIDLQVNGYKGVDFSSPELTEKDCVQACSELLENGTAGFLATLITSSEEIYRKNLKILAKIISLPEFNGKVLGIHAEGPFISKKPGAVGAHNPDWVRKPSIEFFNRMQEWAQGNIRLITIAAEVEGAAELAKYAAKNGITVSLGHQLAKEEDIRRLADLGAKALTHLGNGMPNMVHRHHNQIFAGLAEDKLVAMIIADGHHLPEPVLKTFIRAKGVSNIVITSDTSPIAGLKPGKYEVLGNEAVLEENGLLHNPQKQCMVGSSATMLECMNYLASLNLLKPEELDGVGFYNPLRLINTEPTAVKSDYTVVFDKNKNIFKIQK